MNLTFKIHPRRTASWILQIPVSHKGLDTVVLSATESVLRALCLVHNLIQVFQDKIGMRPADRPKKEGERHTLETLRNTLFTCAAVLGRRGRQVVPNYPPPRHGWDDFNKRWHGSCRCRPPAERCWDQRFEPASLNRRCRLTDESSEAKTCFYPFCIPVYPRLKETLGASARSVPAYPHHPWLFWGRG